MSISSILPLIFSNPGVFVQDFDGRFLIFSNEILDSDLLVENKVWPVNSLSHSKLFIPTFFDMNESNLKTFHFGFSVERVEIIHQLQNYLDSIKIKSLLTLPKWNLQPRHLFDEDFNHIQNKISLKQLDKAVAMTSEKSSWIPTLLDRMQLLLNLLKNCPKHLYLYSHWNENGGVIGASPEFLFYRKDHLLQTMALAGTLDKRTAFKTLSQSLSTIESIKSKDTLKKDMLNSDEALKANAALKFIENKKELSEHQYVVEDLTDKLNHFSKEVQISGPKVIEFPHLFHLQTEIIAKLDTPTNGHDTFDYHLTKRLHPSSALGLKSKTIPWLWLKQLHGHQNLGYFGAPIGIKVPGGYFCLVGIRNIEWNPSGSSIRAGSGIVEQSNSDGEWKELEAKRESVKSLLGLNPTPMIIKNQELTLS